MLQQVFAEPDLVPRRPGELQAEGSLEDEHDAGAEAEVSDLLPLLHLLLHLLHLLAAAGGTLQHRQIQM